MTTCPTASLTPFRCPTQDEIEDGIAQLWPRGRAWPVTQDPGLFARFKLWLAALSPTKRATIRRDDYPPGYVQCGTSKAIADVFAFAVQRWCDLREEFWCATQVETRDLWMQEYGLPDPCDPFPDLCVKVAAIGGARCEYFNSIVARVGWVVDCVNFLDTCGARAGCARTGPAIGGTSRTGWSHLFALQLIVHTGDPADDPSIATFTHKMLAGIARAGQRPACDTVVFPAIHPVRCLIERIAPAHVQILYVT